ncbi:MAG: PHP domain-containing protein [Roseburia sp.]
MKADMHIHSTVSDGYYTIEEIIEKAKERGLDAIAITDHDTLSHRKQIPKECGVQVIPGIEISCYDYEKDYRVHILGYKIQRPEIVEKVVQPTLEARHANSMKQIEILKQEGYEIDLDKIKKADGKYIYKQHIMDYLCTTGQVEEMFGEFYYRTFKNNGICHFDIEYLNPVKAVEAIKEAGGIAVLAHSGQQQNFELIPGLVQHGLDGLELNHHANSDQDKKRIREYAEQYHLLLTGGSDCHGLYEPNSPEVGDYLAEEKTAEYIFGQ